jgi:hypothetical protein
LIKRMAPALAKFPFNGRSAFERKIRRAVRRWLPSFATRGR